MLVYELDQNQNNLTCEMYPYTTELKYIVFKIAMELKEVIEIFSASPFLGDSQSRDSDENTVENQILKQEKK